MSTAQDLPVGLATAVPDAGGLADDFAPAAPLAGSRARLSIVPDDFSEASRLDGLDHAETVLPTGAGPGDLAAEIAFDDILRRATPRLVRFAQRRLGNRHEAEEVAQEALLRTFQNRHKLATEDDVMAWATFVTSRLVIDRVRVRGRSISMAEVPEGRRTSPDTAAIAEARAEARIALDALDALPGRQASVLWAREVEGLRYDEIGARFGLSEPTVRSLLHRGRKALRKEYTLRGGTIPVGGAAILGPWLWPIKHANRLRNAAVTVIGTTALGVLSLGILTLGTPSVNLPSGASPATAQSKPPLAHAAAAVAAAPLVHSAPRTAVNPAQITGFMPSTASIARVCSTRNVGVNCAVDATPRRLWIRVPGTPIGTYIGNYDAPCNNFPPTPSSGVTAAASPPRSPHPSQELDHDPPFRGSTHRACRRCRLVRCCFGRPEQWHPRPARRLHRLVPLTGCVQADHLHQPAAYLNGGAPSGRALGLGACVKCHHQRWVVRSWLAADAASVARGKRGQQPAMRFDGRDHVARLAVAGCPRVPRNSRHQGDRWDQQQLHKHP